ncbi:MAG: hypothetical protein JNK72_10665 [Myxococcales bacterium]|nr:hypothetical protein [Myxococcales bacterium]
MGSGSLFPTIMPFVVLLVVGAMWFNGRRMRAQFLSDNPQYGLGVLAQRLGLQLVQGDPGYNLLVNNRDTQVAAAVPLIAGMTGNTPAVEALATGQHRGHPVRFVFYDQTRVEKGVLETVYTRTFSCSIEVGVAAAVPPFELVLRNENEYLRTEQRLDAPAQPFGHHALDPVLVLRSIEPRVAPVLAPVLGALMAMGYVHILGEGQSVRFVFTALGASTGLYYAETVLQVLLAIADVLEGKPAVMVPPPAPPPAR